MKKFTAAIMILSAGVLLAQFGPPPPPPREHGPGPFGPGKFKKRPSGKHPLLFALESDDFTEEERTRLKKLSSENPREFNREMRAHFQKKRHEQAVKLLSLREKSLKAATPQEKEKANKELRDYILADTMRHEKFQKKMLEESEKSIRMMEKRLQTMKDEFKKRSANRDAFVDARVKEILSDKVPPHILRDAGTKK